MRQIQTPINPQVFTDGLATFWQVANVASKGNKPQYATTQLLEVPFAARTVGDIRYYAAMQADSKLAMVIRIPRVVGIQPAGDLVTLAGDDRQYRVQKVSVNTLTVPESMDVTLELSKQTYIIREEAEG